jgi:hypothetical protein
MMKKLFLCLIVLFSLGGAVSLFSQQVLYFGLSGGATIPVLDFDKDAVYHYESVSAFEKGVKVDFAPQADFIPSINASLYFGFEANKYLGVRLGADFYFLVTEKAPVDFYHTDTSNKKVEDFKGTISYQYNLLTVPLLMQLYFINKDVFRLGVEAGPFFGFPLGTVARTTDPSSSTKDLEQRFSVGLQLGLISEFKIGRGAITFNIDFVRDFYDSLSPVMPDVMANPDATVAIPDSVSEGKFTIFQGIKVSLGYKYNIQLSGAPAATTDVEVDVDNINYYMVMGTQAEGPLKINEMRNLHRRGMLKADTMLWKSGMDNWAPAADFEEFALLFR